MRPLARGTGDGREKDTIKMTFEPQTTTVQVSTPLERQQIQYVAEYCGLRQTVAFQHSSQLRLQLPSGEAITTRNAILREIVKGSKFAADLLGDQPLADALVRRAALPASTPQYKQPLLTAAPGVRRYGSGLLSATSSLCQPKRTCKRCLALLSVSVARPPCHPSLLLRLTDDQIHDHLATRTYLATPHKPSLADLVLATLVHRPVVRPFDEGSCSDTGSASCCGPEHDACSSTQSASLCLRHAVLSVQHQAQTSAALFQTAACTA